MKRKILSIVLTFLLALSTIGFLTACGQSELPPENNGNANVITSNILDGKIANFMGATALAIQDKTAQPKPSGASLFSVSPFADTDVNTQKRNELIKQTQEGEQDVCFYQSTDEVKSYDQLNDKYTEHHHDGVLCLNTDCDQISDELQQEESLQQNTVVSLEARVNKLYNFENFTFMSVSSAVTGNIRVITQKKRAGGDVVYPEQIGSVSGVINYGNNAESSVNGVSYIEVSSGDKKGVIFVKRNTNETFYHTANYWNDDFNQSYLIDNQTGITYSLAQFPQIYSVESGIIKVYNPNPENVFDSKTSFDLYRPKIQDGQLEFVKVNIPVPQELARSPYNVKTDVYGNMVIFGNALVETTDGYDLNGEKKGGDKVIFAGKNREVYMHANAMDYNRPKGGNYGGAIRYHRGDDGKIYRIDFEGDFAAISLSVLDQNCQWQPVPKDVQVTFPYEERMISYLTMPNPSLVLINKIKDGYAYYSTAAQTDGYAFWQGLVAGNNYENDGEYCGVIKISVDGPEKSEMFGDARYGYVQFEQLISLREQGKIDRNGLIVAVGETQMLCFYKDDTLKTKAVLVSVETGLVKDLGYFTLTDIESQSIKIEGYGYLALYKDVDLNAQISDAFTQEPTTRFGELDAYYKILTQKQ